jgi:AcrR family transcriptional regulator
MARRTLLKLDERILSWVISEGALKGTEGISTSRIASQLRISEPTIFVHFRSKENLLFEADRSALHALYSSLGANLSENPRQNALKALLSLGKNAQAHPKEAAYAFFYHARYDATPFLAETQGFLALLNALKPFEPNPSRLLILEDGLGGYAYRSSEGKMSLEEEPVEKFLDALLTLVA